MSVFTCGGMRAQQSWQRSARVSAASQANVDAVVARALAVGINHFETARGYGTSEAQLGKALARHPRSAFALQTKLRPNADPAAFEAQLEESFALLGVDVVDLLSFHGLNTPNCVELTLGTGCWEIADRFRRAGRINHIGFSSHASLRLLLDIIATDRFDYLNLHAYYVFQDNLPAIVARLESAYADAVGADFARRWSHGLPEWTDVPGKINLRRILWLYNLVRAYDLLHYAQERYISMSADNHWVPGARAADFNDDELTAALPDSPFRAEIPTLLRRAHEMLFNPTVKPRP